MAGLSPTYDWKSHPLHCSYQLVCRLLGASAAAYQATLKTRRFNKRAWIESMSVAASVGPAVTEKGDVGIEDRGPTTRRGRVGKALGASQASHRLTPHAQMSSDGLNHPSLVS